MVKRRIPLVIKAMARAGREARGRKETRAAWFQRETVEGARDGSRDAALALLEDFAHIVAGHTAKSWTGPIPFVYAEYLAAAFRGILKEGVAPADALRVRNARRGKRKGDTLHDAEALAAAVAVITRSGIAVEDAIMRLSEEIDRRARYGAKPIDRRTIQRARSDYKGFCADASTDDLNHSAKPYAAELEAILTAVSKRQ